MEHRRPVRSLVTRGVFWSLLLGASIAEARGIAGLSHRSEGHLVPRESLEEFVARLELERPELSRRQDESATTTTSAPAGGRTKNPQKQEPIISGKPGLATPPGCRVGPQDALWPENSYWNALMSELDYNLIKTIPAAAPCHSDSGQYNPQRCYMITKSWTDSTFQYVYQRDQSRQASIM
jgi:hypothetical protein